MLRVLVVEDEVLLALDLEDLLKDAGATVWGPVATVEGALALLKAYGAPDCALLNVQIRNGTSYPVADELQRWGVPFAFVTSLRPDQVDARFCKVPVLAKASSATDIARALAG
jgi:CheY-like chemotaxis protein